jgi:NTE family protein
MVGGALYPCNHPMAPGRSGSCTAFVLSGGASLAAVQVGMLEALYERDIAPDFLVATSAGALNAAFVASRPQTPATAKALGRIWRSLQREDIFPVRPAAVIGGLCGRRDHLVSDRGLRDLAGRYIEFADLGEAVIPLHVVAFDLSESREVLLSQGSAVDAVTASAAIPGVLPAVMVAGRRLVDGGVVNNTPISHAVELGADKIYVLAAMDPFRPVEHLRRGALDAAVHAVELLAASRLQSDLIRYSQCAELIVLPAPNPAGVQPTNFGHAARLMSGSRAAAHAVLSQQLGGRHLQAVAR